MMRNRYDTAIVGAGTAGCVLAARLSEDAHRSVLLLEAGVHHRTLSEFPEALRYSLIMSGCLPTDSHNWAFIGRLGPSASQPVPRGKVVGGSSAINGALFLRGAPQDFDAWAARGNDLWSYRQVLPYFRKLETDHDIHDEFHGANGPMPVKRPPKEIWPPVAHAFYEACLARGFPEHRDKNTPAATGIGAVPTNTVNGLRMNTAVTYLLPVIERPNLTVQSETLVRRIVFEGKRAIGLETTSPDGNAVIEADQIVLCAGAIMSPCLLMLSGVGPAETLRPLSIPPVLDAPNVGRHASDHCSARVSFRLRMRHAPELTVPSNPLMLQCASSSGEPCDDIQMSLFTVPPNVRLLYGLGLAARARMLMKSAHSMPLRKLAHQIRHGGDLALLCTLTTGLSRGSVSIRSADPYTKPYIDHNFLEDPGDLKRLRRGVEIALELLDERAFVKLGATRTTPAHADIGSAAALERWIRRTIAASAHLSGTCRMGLESDPTAVVDQHCRVLGIEGLRVIDASVMPAITSRSPYATVLMIAERAADLIGAS